MSDMEPITREEALMNGDYIEPITREEMILAGEDIEPITRREWFLKKYRGGGDIEVVTLHANENTTYVAPEGQAYSPVVVEVPVPTLTTLEADENGTYTAPSGTAYNEVEVYVPLPENAYLLKDIENTPTAIATFSDGSNLPMPKLEVGIEPVQEGSGDPSPTNVRPISGWDEVNVTNNGGINQWNEEWEIGALSSDGSIDSTMTLRRTTSFIRVRPQESYYFPSPCLNGRYAYYDRGKNLIEYNGNGFNTYVNTIPSGVYYVRVTLASSYGTTYNNDISINYPSTDTSYHAYNGQTYTIDLDGTRYGGKVDLVSGVMTVEKGYVDLGDLNWTLESGIFRLNESIGAKLTTNTSAVANMLCSIYKTVSQNDMGSTSTDHCIAGLNWSNGVRVKDSDYTDITSFKTAMDGVQLVYELATPLTIQLTPTVVKSLRGVNNVWADSGDVIDGKYFGKEE